MSGPTEETLRLARALLNGTFGAPAHCASVDLVTPSVANLREHFAQKAKRASGHRKAGYLMARGFAGGFNRALVILTRHAPRLVDSDNLAALLKNVRDGVADGLQVDDRDPSVIWHTQQVKAKTAAVSVSIWVLS